MEKPKEQYPLIDLGSAALEEKIVRLIPPEFSRKYKAIAVGRDGKVLTVAFADPCDACAREDIRFVTGFDIQPVAASEQEIARALDRFYPPLPAGEKSSFGAGEFGGDAHPAGGFGAEEELEGGPDEETAPVVRLVDKILRDAIGRSASDIHLEPVRNGIRVRTRVDGLLMEQATCPLAMSSAIISRIKIMARCDVAERRLPQDGAIDLEMSGRTVRLRVSILPTATGERIVLRVLDKEILVFDLGKLGFSSDDMERIDRALRQPEGMVLVGGPKGAGAKSTLYSFIGRLHSPETCVLTAENPIDFDFDGVGQVQVKEELGYTYAAALAAFLQQDPDVIMIQELRDAEAANAAVQAAMDAALILTSLTAEDTAAALAKLSAWGVPPTLLAAAARLVISQRGIRSLCPHCKVEYTPMPDQLKRAGILNIGLKEIDGRSPAELTLFKPRGCERCAMTGYRGRLLVYELMDVTEPVREAILRGANGGEIRRIAVEAGMETVSRNALRRALEGMTSLEECMKIFPAGLRPW